MRFWPGVCASHQRSSGYQFVFEFPTLPIWMVTEVISLSSLLDHSCSAIVRAIKNELEVRIIYRAGAESRVQCMFTYYVKRHRANAIQGQQS